MTTTYKAFANAKGILVSNAETIVSSPAAIPASSLLPGDVIRIRLIGTLDPSQQYQLNVRLGANGNTGDQLIFSSNNQLTSTVLKNDLTTWSTANPGFTPDEYHFPWQANNAASIPQTPVKLDGELHLVCVANNAPANTANLHVVAPFSVTDQSSLIGSQGVGILASNVVVTSANVASNVTVTLSMTGKGTYVWKGVGQGDAGTPNNGWKFVQGANSGTSVVSYSLIELM